MIYLLSLIVLISSSICFGQIVESKNKNYSIPALFDFKNSVKKIEYGFSYEVSKNELFLENLGRFNEKTFSLSLVSEEEAKNISSKSIRGNYFLEVKMPYGFFKDFNVQLINKSGKQLLVRPISNDQLEAGKSLGQVQRFVLDDLDGVIKNILEDKESVKLCMDQSDSKMFTRLCSRNFGFLGRDKKYELKFEPQRDSEFRVLVDNEPAPLKNRIPVKSDMPLRAYFEFQNGVVFEMVNQVKPLELIEVTQDGPNYKFFGVGGLPQGALRKDRKSITFLNNVIPFDGTIGDFRDFYFLTIPASTVTPTVAVEGKGGGLFQCFLTLENVPKESDRIYFLNDTSNATYLSDFKLYGISYRKLKFDTQSKVSVDRATNQFEWETVLDKKGEFNDTTLDFDKENGVGKNRVSLQVYRGFSQEFSLKLTGIKTETQFVTIGEVSYNKWFESFGTKPGSLLYQRLGIGVNYFKSFNKIEISGNETSSALESQSVAMKYRFTPGLWNWDESVGVITSYQTVTYDGLITPLIGLGAFWARSMPQAFDRVFNLVPFFRYPKWVDVDFVYFPMSLDPTIRTDGSMAINFHGKILWSKRIYGEAGFGYKAFSFANELQLTEVQSLYLTIGLGLNF